MKLSRIDIPTNRPALLFASLLKGNTVACASSSDAHVVTFWNVASRTLIGEVGWKGEQGTVPILTLDDDKQLLLAVDERDCVNYIDTTTMKRSRVRFPRLAGTAMALSPDKRVLLVEEDFRIAHLWSLADKTRISSFENDDQFSDFAFSPDSKRVVAVGYDGVMRLWDVRSGEMLFDFPGHDEPGFKVSIRSVAFAPSGKLIATGSNDNRYVLKLWSTESLGRSFPLHDRQYEDPVMGMWDVFGVAFSPTSRRLVSTHNDGSLILWDVRKHVGLFREMGDDEERRERYYAVQFAEDGKHIVAGNDDGTISIWRIHD